MNVPQAAYRVLQDHPEGLSAKTITEEIISRKLHTLPDQDPVGIVTRALYRHCVGIERSYSCQDRFFSTSNDKKGDVIFRNTTSAPPSDDWFSYPSSNISKLNRDQTDESVEKTRIMNAENQTIRKVLTSFCFHVPDYQRSYSWKLGNIDEFIDDLFAVIHSDDDNARHFLGAITMAKNNKAIMDLIDGQQRMTTIFIVLYVILGEYKTRFKSIPQADGRAAELKRMVAYLNDNGETVSSRLILGKYNQEFFEEYVMSSDSYSDESRESIKRKYIGNHQFVQNQAIFDAFNRIKLSIEERLDLCENEAAAYEYLKAIHSCLYDRFEIVSMTVEEEANAFLIFETLNDRGLALSAVDLIKNKLFQVFATHQNEFEEMKSTWEQMCSKIDNKDNIKKYLLHYWRSSIGYVSPQMLYKNCRDYIEQNGFEGAKAFVKELADYSVYYNYICDGDSLCPWQSEKLKNTLGDLRRLGYDLAHPIILASVKKFSSDEEAIEKAVRLCLNFLIRYISVLKHKPTSIEKEICVWACSPDLSIDFLKEKFTEKAPDVQFREQLNTLSMPYSNKLTHYLLCVYEAEGFDRHEFWSSPGRWENTVEHILPQDVKATTTWGQYWISQFGSVEQCDAFKERLGNYAFLTQRAQPMALNKDFAAKKEVYASRTDMRLTMELIDYADWNQDNINERQKKMAEVWVKSISFK